MRLTLVAAASALIALAASSASATDLIYKPINPSFGGDPLNGNWLLSQATAQTEGGGAPGFTIDFPDFGGIPQPPEPTAPEVLPPVNPGTPATGN
jgi:curli production assembly/transport component CsgF